MNTKNEQNDDRQLDGSASEPGCLKVMHGKAPQLPLMILCNTVMIFHQENYILPYIETWYQPTNGLSMSLAACLRRGGGDDAAAPPARLAAADLSRRK